MNKETKQGFFDQRITKTKIKSANVKFKEMFFGYFIGPIGALLASGIFTSFLNKYFTDTLFAGVTSEHLTTFLTLLPLLSTILIVVGNLVVGQLIEKTKTKQGKARPWILLSSIVLSVACVLMFIVPFDNLIGKMIFLGISYNLYYAVAYPLYNTANSTLIPLSTRNSKSRGLLASFTNVAGLAVMGAGSMVFPIVVSLFLKTQISWTITFIGVGVITFICTLLQYYFTRERVTEETINSTVPQEKISMKKQLSGIGKDKFWWIIIIFYLVFQFSGAIKNLSMVYFCEYSLDNAFWGLGSGGSGFTQTLIAVLGAVPMALASLIVWPLSNKFGKKIVTFVGMIIGVIGGVVAIIGGSNVIIVAIGIALKCLGSAPACYMILALISDELDHLEAKNGYRCDGITMSIYSSIMVAATGIGTAIFNGLLGQGSVGGYVAPITSIDGIIPPNITNEILSTTTNVDGTITTIFVQNSSVLTNINISYLWVETVAYAICAILIIFFTVEKNLESEQLQIVARQKERALANNEVWIEPAERLILEQAAAEKEEEENRIKELKEKCTKKNLDFITEEAKYQEKLARKNKNKKK